MPPSECLVAIETAYNLLVDFLLDCGYLVYLISPQATKGYRNRQRSTDAHTDDTDAALLSSILHTDLDSHRRLQPNSALTQQILPKCGLSTSSAAPSSDKPTNSGLSCFASILKPSVYSENSPLRSTSIFSSPIPLLRKPKA